MPSTLTRNSGPDQSTLPRATMKAAVIRDPEVREWVLGRTRFDFLF